MFRQRCSSRNWRLGPPLVQRFGRCNRRGDFADARIRWITLDPAKLSAPYTEAELARAVGRLQAIEALPTGAAPANLEQVPLDAADGRSIRTFCGAKISSSFSIPHLISLAMIST